MSTKKNAKGRRLQLEGTSEDSPRPASAEKDDDVDEIGDSEEEEDDKGTAAANRFFTPRKSAKTAASAVITPSPAAKKRRALLTEIPEKKKKKKTATARKTKTITDVFVAEEEPYVPKHIHANVGYTRFGQTNHLSDGKKVAFNFIADNYVLPSDFETNRKYGPLSGVCYEERAIAAYATNMLEAKDDADAKLLKKGVCSNCGSIGHKNVRCPALI